MTHSCSRSRLREAARRIAASRNERPATPVKALRKLLIQECRDWARPGTPRIGWKRGELSEVVGAVVTSGDVAGEWGDVGYYVAQAWHWLWWLYAAVTPANIIEGACAKFERRAEGGK
jgi:hypothetical protein